MAMLVELEATSADPHGLALRRVSAVAPVAVACAVLAVANFVRLGAAPWGSDELTYARAGAAYLRGSFNLNPQHPLLAKLLFGVAEHIGGASPLSVRVVSAFAATLLGLGLGVVAGRRWGLPAGAIAILLWAAPMHSPLPVSRIGLLEPVTTLLAGASLLCGWRWWCHRDIRWAVAAGGFSGLAAGAKVTGVCALATLVAFALIYERSRRVAVHLAAATAAAGAAFALTYLPAGTHAAAMVKTMVKFQSHHAATGHPILLAGHVYQRAPWWTMTDYLAHADGWLPLVVVALLSAAAVALSTQQDRRFAVFLALAAAVPLAALSLSPVQLPHYVYIVTPWLMLLAVAGMVQLWRRGKAIGVGSAPVALIALTLLSMPLLVASVAGVRNDLASPPRTYAALPSILHAQLRSGGQVAVWGDADVAAAYLGDVVTAHPCTTTRCNPSAIVIDQPVAQRFPNPTIQALLATDHFNCHAEDGLTICLPPSGPVSGSR